MLKHLLWLWTMHRASLICRRPRLLFSDRKRFLDELRPKIILEERITYPDAIFFVTPEDLKRAEALLSRPRKRGRADTGDITTPGESVRRNPADGGT